MKKIISLHLVLFIALSAFAQPKTTGIGEKGEVVTASGLVVGIVVDQMRYDFLFRFWNKYSNDGFKRLVNEGFVFSNANFNYVPTNTAPGHACIYTGTTPAVNGIINNEWFDRYQNKSVYCVSDTTVDPVGTTSISGKMSPRNLLTTTITDELKLATNMRSKVIGIALKDRGAILPAGNSGDAAYWHDSYTNNWITSSYYMKELPAWVNAFNKRKMADSLLGQKWTTLLPIESYTESTADDNAYEGLFSGETKPVFPHDLPALKAEESELIRKTPFGNTFTNEFAMAAVSGENLGKRNVMDFLAISYSSTDIVGHMYGTNAIELEDTYLRLDRDIATLLSFLDKWTGNNYLLFLTSDHGAANNPFYATDRKLKAGKYDRSLLSDSLKRHIAGIYGTDAPVNYASTHNIFLNRTYIEEKKLNLSLIQEQCAAFVTRFKGVAVAMTASELSKGIARSGVYAFMQNGFNLLRSSDVMIQLQPGWIDWSTKTGTTHGTFYSYDTHVPVIFFGRKIKPGDSSEPISICDIAPTIATFLNIEFPNGNSGKPLNSILK